MCSDCTTVDTVEVFADQKMKPEVKVIWLKALNSGKYKQGKNKLRKVLASAFSKYKNVEEDSSKTNPNDDRYCCLGVLCEEYRKATGKGYWEIDEDGEYKFYDGSNQFGGHTSYSMPTSDVFEWAGINFSDRIEIDEEDRKKYASDNKSGISLAELNDNGRTFKTIGKLIEKYL